nr:MAG TPA: putative structural protein [Caudoviricetes sp.]
MAGTVTDINIDKLSITQVDQITAFDGNDLEFIMDEVTETTLSQEEEITDITGRGGRKIGSLKKNKAVTGKGTNGLIVGGALAAMVGSEVEENEEEKVRYTDTSLKVASNKASIEKKESLVGATGQEIIAVYVKNKDGSLGKKFTQNAAAAAGEFSYAEGEITFNEGELTDGTELVAFYDIKVKAKKVSNVSDKYSKTLKLYIDCTAQDTCDNQYHVQFIIPRADFHGTFDLTFGGDPSTQDFEFGSLAGGCGGSNSLWDMVVFA